MSEQTPEPVVEPATDQAPVVTPDPPAAPASNSLEDLLKDFDGKDIVLEQVRKARNEAKSLRDRVKEYEPKVKQLDELQAAQMTAEQKAQADLKAATDRATALMGRAVQSEVKALAAGTFADATDAVAGLGDLTKYADANGEIDSDAIKADLSDLLSRKPHWGKRPATLPVNPAQGSSANNKPVAQLTREDLKKMSTAEIVQAQKEGRVNDLLGKK